MCWNSGTPEPPGLQKRLHKPWPTPPITPNNTRHSQINARPNSGIARPVSGTLLPTNPSQPVPDMIGSEGVPTVLKKATESAFSPHPPALPSSERVGKVAAGYPLAYLL